MADPEKLSQQPLAQSPGAEGDLFYSVQAGQTRRMTRTILRTAILSAWQGFIGTFLGAANQADARAAIGAAAPNENTTGSAAKLTTARNIAATGDVAWGVNFDGSANATAAATVARKVSPAYIDGLELTWVSANAITLETGSAFIQGAGAVVDVATAIAKTGLVLTAATKYHAYLFLNDGVPDVEFVTTAPSVKVYGNARTKTGDTSRRYIGSFFTAGANAVIRFKQNGVRVTFLALPATALTSGMALTSSNVSFASYVPETATHATTAVAATHTNGAVVYVNDADMGAVTSTNQIMASGANQQFTIDLSLSSALLVNYIYDITPTPGGLYLRVQGFIFER